MADGADFESGDVTLESGDVRIWPIATGKVRVIFQTPKKPEIELSIKKPEIIFN